MTVRYAWTTRDLVEVVGPDAPTYLQGQLSQDVLAMAVGSSAPTFVLAPQGKVDGWGRIARVADDAFTIDADAGSGAAWVARLQRFLLRTKAEVTLTESVAMLAVRGEAMERGTQPLGSIQGADLFGIAEADVASVVPVGAVEVDASALEVERILAGVPTWGNEVDQETIPATLGQWVIDASVSFTKGCYTGQELVARIDSRGGNVPKRLAGLVIDGAAPPAGTPVVVAGTDVGAVTSSASDGDRTVALAFAPRSIEIGDGGVAVQVGGSPATMRLLPMV